MWVNIHFNNFFFWDSFENFHQAIYPSSRPFKKDNEDKQTDLDVSNMIKNCSQNKSQNNWHKHNEDYMDKILKSVEVIEHLSDSAYDELLSENVVFLNLIDASAVNTVIECVVRNTPLIINRLPAIFREMCDAHKSSVVLNI